MLPFLRKKLHDGWMTVLCRGGRIEIAHLVRVTGEKPLLRMLEVFADEGNLDDALIRLRAERGLDQYRCVALLEEHDYRLVLTENPGVPDEELTEALRWRLKEVVDFPVIDAAIAPLHLVSNHENVRPANLFAVAASRAAVSAQMTRMGKARLKLEAIDIPELAVRNIAVLHEKEGRGLGFLYLGASFSLLIVTFKGELMLSRRMEMTAGQLLAADPERRIQMIERLGLDVQRTMDNFDRQYGFVSVSHIVLASTEAVPDVLTRLGDSVYFPLQAMDLADVLDFPAIPELRNPVWQGQCLLSLGAALRENP